MTTQTFFAEISSIQEPKTNDLMKCVSNERRVQLAKFKFDIDRKLSLYAELLVRYQACKTLGLNNKEIIFIKNRNGKPYMQYHPEFQFNISHTRSAIAVACSNNEIGIDIEKINLPEYKIAKRFFTSYEQEHVFSHEHPERAFYEIWTKKEAYIKHIGTGLSTQLNSFNVLDVKNVSMSYTVEIRDYIISVCCKELLAKEPTFINMTESELQSFFLKIPTV